MKSYFKLAIYTFLLLGFSSELFAQSMYSDVKARRVGDVITIVLAENVTGAARTDAGTQSSTAGSTASSITGNFIPFEPFFGADAQVDFNSDERIFANQSNLLRGTISVRIEEVTGSGELFVRGSRTTEINGEIHRISLEGVVRSFDINDLNQVMSFKVANADIKYTQEQTLTTTRRKSGFFRKAIFIAVGAVATAAVFVSQSSSGGGSSSSAPATPSPTN